MSDSYEKIIEDMRSEARNMKLDAVPENYILSEFANRLTALSGLAAQTAAPVALKIADLVDGYDIASEVGFVRCDACGGQIDTGTCDGFSELRQLVTEWRALKAAQPDTKEPAMRVKGSQG